jgi:hypothetical protein
MGMSDETSVPVTSVPVTSVPVMEKSLTVVLEHKGIHEPPAIVCRCRVVDNQIHFCALHDSAKRLLTTCQLVRKVLGNLKVSKQEDQSLISELVLPYVDNEISAAQS